jgi:hypothetical protein
MVGIPRSTMNLEMSPHQDRRLPNLDGACHLILLEALWEFNELSQLLMVVSGVLLLLIEQDLLLPQHLVEAEGVLGVGTVHTHLVKVLLTSSLGFHLFSIKVGTDHDQGLLGDPGVLLPRGEGLLPPCQLLRHLHHCHGRQRRGGPKYNK